MLTTTVESVILTLATVAAAWPAAAKTSMLSRTSGCLPPPPAAVGVEGCREAAAAPAPPVTRSKLFHHLRYHQAFPATRAGVLEAVGARVELDADERGWLAAELPARTYASGAEVLRALFPTTPAPVLARLEAAAAAVAHR